MATATGPDNRYGRDWISNNAAPSAMAPQLNVAIVVSGAATTAVNQLYEIGSSSSATGGYFTTPDDVQGQIVVPPGCIFGITSLSAGTSATEQSTLVWEEINYP